MNNSINNRNNQSNRNHRQTQPSHRRTGTESVIAAIAQLQNRKPEQIQEDTVVRPEELAALQLAAPRIGLVWHTDRLRVVDVVQHLKAVGLS